jgi:chromosome segregation ATPase
MSSLIEKQYYDLKKTLEAMNYLYPLGMESVPLVKKILDDYMSVCEKFQQLKLLNHKVEEELKSEKDVYLPLRSENSKLVKENNDLHNENIKIKDDLDFKDTHYGNIIKKLEQEKAEAKFLLIQKDLQVKNIEIESEGLKKKLNELFQKLYGDVTNSKQGLPNAEKILKTMQKTPINFVTKKTEMEMSKGLDSNNQFFEKLMENTIINKEEWANDLKEADERALKFRKDLKASEERNNDYQRKIEQLERQVKTRDLEIRRLQNSYSLPENMEELKMKYQSETLKNQVEKLNSQIDFLNKENHGLKENTNFHNHRCKEEEVRKLDKKIKDLKTENQNLLAKLETFEKNSKNNLTQSNSGTGPKKYDDSAVQDLFNQNKELKREKDKFEEELRVLSNAISRVKLQHEENSSLFNSEKLILTQSYEKAKNENIKLKDDLEDYITKYNKLTRTFEDLTAELNLLKGRELIINKDMESNKDNVHNIYREYNKLVEDCNAFRRKVTRLEEENIELKKDNQELQKEKENLDKLNTFMNKKLSNYEDETTKMKFSNDSNSTRLQKLENEIQILETKKNSLEIENRNINSLIENKNKIIQELEAKCDSFFKQLTASNETTTTVQIEYKNLSKDLTELSSKNRRLEEKLKTYEKDFSENRYVKEKIHDYEENLKQMREQKCNFENQCRTMKKEIISLNDKVGELTREIKEKETMQDNTYHEIERLKKELELKTHEMLVYEEKVSNNKGLVYDNEEAKKKINELNSKASNLKLETEKLKSDKSLLEFEIKKKNIEITKQSENFENLKIETNALKDQNSKLMEKLERMTEELTSKKLADNTNMCLSNLELQEKISAEKRNAEKLQYTTNQLNEKVNKLAAEKEHLIEKVQTMTKLLNEADQMRGEMFNKLQEEMGKNKASENETMVLKERERNHVKEINKLREEANSLKLGLGQYDKNFDNINNQLDTKTEEIAKLNLLVNTLQEANDDLTKKLNLNLSKSGIDNRRIIDKEREVKEIKILVQQLENDNINLNNLIEERNKEIQDLSYELKCVASENTTLIEDIQRLVMENEKLKNNKNQLEKNTENVFQKIRSKEMEYNEMVNTYKDMCKENERLNRNLKIFVDENRECANYIKQLETTLNNCQHNMSTSQIEKDNLNKRIEFLEKYNNELTKQIQNLRDELYTKDTNTEYLLRNVEVDREVNLNYESHIMTLQKQVAKLEGEKRSMQEAINNLNSQNAFLGHTKDRLEENIKSFENIIAEERKKMLSVTQANQMLRLEIDKLNDENRKIMKSLGESKDIRDKLVRLTSQNCETSQCEGEENTYLKQLIGDLNNQINGLQNELCVMREENTKLMSERSLRDMNLMSSARDNYMMTNSINSSITNSNR